MDDDIIRILVGTDNHLGFLEKDPVRYNDSFAAFDELLLNAKFKKADMVLLAGDVFHENKPSRRTMFCAMDILRKRCTGDDAVFIQILNEQQEIFKTRQGKVNYEDPYYAVSLPVFSIHGNHDDPTREGGSCQPLAAMDLMSVCNLVNYFGQAAQVDDIEIIPILIKKGTTTVAIYGLGAIRDERLNRMWNQKKVKFIRPPEEQGRDSFFNIFVIHQNRDYGRGVKNCVHESMIPEWMDLVIWGNEHECQPKLNESLVGTFRIYQPGSSVACSLVEGESNAYPKHMGLIEIKQRFFRLFTTRFTQVRPFKYSDLSLKDAGLDPQDPKIEDHIKQLLVSRVTEMIREAKEEAQEGLEEGYREEIESQLDYHVQKPELVLIRLRVEHTGFPSINQQRFGSQFVGKVANPSTLLLFSKKKEFSASSGGDFKAKISSGGGELEEEALEKIRIEDLVIESLQSSNKRLGLLAETDLSSALEEFVMKTNTSAISDLVDETLEHTQEQLLKDTSIAAADKNTIAEAAMRVKLATEKSQADGKTIKSKSKVASTTKNSAVASSSIDLDLNDDDDDDAASGKKSAPKKPASKAKVTDDAESRGEGRGRGRGRRGGGAREGARGRGRGRGRGGATSALLDDSEEEIIDSDDGEVGVVSKLNSRSKQTTITAAFPTRTTKRAVTKTSYKEIEEVDLVDSEEQETREVRRPTKSKAITNEDNNDDEEDDDEDDFSIENESDEIMSSEDEEDEEAARLANSSRKGPKKAVAVKVKGRGAGARPSPAQTKSKASSTSRKTKPRVDDGDGDGDGIKDDWEENQAARRSLVPARPALVSSGAPFSGREDTVALSGTKASQSSVINLSGDSAVGAAAGAARKRQLPLSWSQQSNSSSKKKPGGAGGNGLTSGWE